MKRFRRLDVRDGYDLWSSSYDATPNPLVELDRRHTLTHFAPRRGEHVLDAACGTGRNLRTLRAAGSRPVGLDLSLGMLHVAKRTVPDVPLIQADLEVDLPIRKETFDSVLCALVGEHLTDLAGFFREVHRLLRSGGRVLFSVFHPEMAAAGIEANFESSGVEYRLGAKRHTVADYMTAMQDAGFTGLDDHTFCGDEELASDVPGADKYLDRPLLLILAGQSR